MAQHARIPSRCAQSPVRDVQCVLPIGCHHPYQLPWSRLAPARFRAPPQMKKSRRQELRVTYDTGTEARHRVSVSAARRKYRSSDAALSTGGQLVRETKTLLHSRRALFPEGTLESYQRCPLASLLSFCRPDTLYSNGGLPCHTMDGWTDATKTSEVGLLSLLFFRLSCPLFESTALSRTASAPQTA